MAEESTTPGSTDGAERTPGQRALPPKRGMLKRLHSKGTNTKQPSARKQQRTPITREDIAGGSRDSRSQSARTAPLRTGRPVTVRPAANRSFVDPGAERMKREEEASKKLEEKKRLDAEKNKQIEARKEQRRLEREEAKKRAEEIRQKKKMAAEKRKAEQERINKQQEEERKQREEERLAKEKALEIKRIEDLKVYKEQERQRILKSIESNTGTMSEQDKEKAQKIAQEIIDRNIVWTGYISLTSGIGGAMLNDL